MTAFQNKTFSVGMAGLDPTYCRHESFDRLERCRYCGALRPARPLAIQLNESPDEYAAKLGLRLPTEAEMLEGMNDAVPIGTLDRTLTIAPGTRQP